MTDEEYLNQTQYFSESAQEFVPVESMPPPYALNAMRKLEREFDGARGTVLWSEFFAYLHPTSKQMSKALKEKGVVSHYAARFSRSAVRNRLHRAAHKVGLKITTHWQRDLMTAQVVTPAMQITVTRREHGQGSSEASGTTS